MHCLHAVHSARYAAGRMLPCAFISVKVHLDVRAAELCRLPIPVPSTATKPLNVLNLVKRQPVLPMW